jgi:hypothetical protein
VSRAAPCTCRGRSRGNSRSNSKCGLPVGWRVGSGGGGRRKPILGGLAAASMPRTPPPPAPSRLRQFSAICWNGSWGQIRFPAENGSDPRFISIPDRCVDQGRHLPTAAEICQRWGGVGCQPHGCGCQASRDGFTASPHSDTAPPTHGEPAFDVDVAAEVAGQRPALQQVQGCKPCRTPPRP